MRIKLDTNYILENKELIIKALVVMLIAVTGLIVFVAGSPQAREKAAAKEVIPIEGRDSTASTEFETSIIVDVSGAVLHPDVVELPAGSRVSDAIDAAGGLVESADVSAVNRAAPLEDGIKIFIPFKKEASNPSDHQTFEESPGADNAGSVININTASAAELDRLPGVGPVTAMKIIDYRNQHGPFRKVEDLKRISGIGDATFAKLLPYIGI